MESLADLKRATEALDQDTSSRIAWVERERCNLANEQAAKGWSRSEKTIAMMTSAIAEETKLIAKSQAEIAAARADIAEREKDNG